jgi:hypothetical protein
VPYGYRVGYALRWCSCQFLGRSPAFSSTPEKKKKKKKKKKKSLLLVHSAPHMHTSVERKRTANSQRKKKSNQPRDAFMFSSAAPPITIDVARTSFAGNFSQPMSEFVAQKIFCVAGEHTRKHPGQVSPVSLKTPYMSSTIAVFFFNLFFF